MKILALGKIHKFKIQKQTKNSNPLISCLSQRTLKACLLTITNALNHVEDREPLYSKHFYQKRPTFPGLCY